MKAAIAAVLCISSLFLIGTASGDRPSPPPKIELGYFSQQVGPSQASVSARISVSGTRSGRDGRSGTSGSHTQLVSLPGRGGAGENGPSYPALASTSPFLNNPHPYGPSTFWYSDGLGHVCIYMAGSVLPCYTVTSGAGGTAGGPGLNPVAIAEAIAGRLDLFPGRIQASPAASRGGLTGAESWFWLLPAPRREVLSIALRGERVTVSAEPSVEWRFGDGGVLFGGAGRPYVPGPPPADSIRHLYETRCLPGDVGRDPYVLSGCGTRGYPVEAVVHWAISFEATGLVSASGSLPSRTTTAGLPYPVSEARAFLVGGGGG
jgi:hypothetical protein